MNQAATHFPRRFHEGVDRFDWKSVCYRSGTEKWTCPFAKAGYNCLRTDPVDTHERFLCIAGTMNYTATEYHVNAVDVSLVQKKPPSAFSSHLKENGYQNIDATATTNHHRQCCKARSTPCAQETLVDSHLLPTHPLDLSTFSHMMTCSHKTQMSNST